MQPKPTTDISIEQAELYQYSALLKAETYEPKSKQFKDLEKIALGFGSYLEIASNVYDGTHKGDKEELKKLRKNYTRGFLLLMEYFETLWN